MNKKKIHVFLLFSALFGLLSSDVRSCQTDADCSRYEDGGRVGWTYKIATRVDEGCGEATGAVANFWMQIARLFGIA